MIITQGVSSSKDITQTPSRYPRATCSHTTMKNNTPGGPGEPHNPEFRVFPLKALAAKNHSRPWRGQGVWGLANGLDHLAMTQPFCELPPAQGCEQSSEHQSLPFPSPFCSTFTSKIQPKTLLLENQRAMMVPHAGFTSKTNFTLQRTRPKPDFSTTEQHTGNQHRNLAHLAVQSTLELGISLCSDPKIIITAHSTPTHPTSACFWDQKGKFPSSEPTPKPTKHSIINHSTKLNHGKAKTPILL